MILGLMPLLWSQRHRRRRDEADRGADGGRAGDFVRCSSCWSIRRSSPPGRAARSGPGAADAGARRSRRSGRESRRPCVRPIRALTAMRAGGAGSGWCSDERAAQQRAAVVRERDRERLGQAPGPARDRALRRLGRESAQRAHAFDSEGRLDRAQQHGRAPAAGLAHHVGAGVHAVAAVGVEMARRAEHRAVARRLPAVRMRAGVASVSDVGLDLDDPSGEACAVGEPMHDQRAHQIPRHHRGSGGRRTSAEGEGRGACSSRGQRAAWAAGIGALS